MTIKAINKKIQAEGIALELVKGSGYFYFMPLDSNMTSDIPSVMVYRFADLSEAQWITEAREAWAVCKAGSI